MPQKMRLPRACGAGNYGIASLFVPRNDRKAKVIVRGFVLRRPHSKNLRMKLYIFLMIKGIFLGSFFTHRPLFYCELQFLKDNGEMKRNSMNTMTIGYKRGIQQ
jgi:hypothetical protein